MFERYTEKARRSIFFARYYASQFGSPYIEPEHLLLGLMMHTAVLKESGKAVRAEIEQGLARGEKTPTSVDLPVSESVKGTMQRAAEEADRLGHPYIGVEHLLLGLMAASDSAVPELLRKHGIDRELILRESPAEPVEAPPDRESLRALVDTLPEGALPHAKRMLQHMQTWPPHLSCQGGFMGGGGGTAFGMAGGGPIRRGRHSSRRLEDGVEVYESRYVRDGHEITSIERFRMSEDGKTLSYTQEISGPGHSLQNTIDFDVSGS